MLRPTHFFALLFTILSGFLSSSCSDNSERISMEQDAPVDRYINELRRDVRRAGLAYNSNLGCYIDLTRPDNSYRFFVLDLAHRKVLLRGVCLNGLTDAQGCVRYSNEINSNCSSRGLASIGERYVGGFGRAFRLYGLEASTHNLRRRAVVLHSWAGVPAEAGTAHPIQSEGCPTLNPQMLDKVAVYIERSSKPILLRFN
jgi:hypothetical protein